MVGARLFLADYVEAVAEGEDDRLDARVGSDHVVEAGYADGLFVLWEWIHADFAVPEYIVGEDESTGAYHVEYEFIILAVLALVGVNVNDIIHLVRKNV